MPSKRWLGRGAARVVGVVGVVGLAGALGGEARGQTLVVDFEGLAAMPNGQGSAVPVAARLADQLLATHNVRFSSSSPYIAVVTLGTGHATSGQRGAGGTTLGGALSYAQGNPIRGQFLGTDGVTPYATTFVTARGDLVVAGGTKTLRAFSIGGALLGESVRQDSDPTPLRVEAPGIHRFEIVGNALSNIAFDDVTFNRPTACASFAAQPQGAQVCPGGSATLRVTLTQPGGGSTLSEFRWRRNGAFIDPAQNPSAVTPVLTLTGLPAGDSASYDCVVTTSCGPLTSAAATVAAVAGGYANCDASTTFPELNALDFGCFLGRYRAGDAYANCDASTTFPSLNAIDFSCFLNRYREGCP